MRTICLSNGDKHFVDDIDYDAVMLVGPWHDSKGFAFRNVLIGSVRKTQRLDRLIADRVGLSGLWKIGHKDGLLSNCCRDNLYQSVKLTGKSGFKGVYWNSHACKWCAILRFGGKSFNLGHYDNAISAARAYDRAAIEYLGDLAVLNFPRSDYELKMPKMNLDGGNDY